MQKRTLYTLTFCLLIWFGALWRSAQFGPLNIDEPFHLTASYLVTRGQILYRDFAFTQGPVLPYVYGPVLRLIGSDLAIGRFVSVGFAALALALVLNIVRRLASPRAAGLAFLLMIATPNVLYYLALVKTFSLVATLTLLALGIVVHSRSSSSGRWPLLSTVVAGLAVLTRLTFLPVLVGVFLFWVWRGRWRVSGVGLLALGLVMLVLAASSNGNLVFDVLEFHLRRVPVDGVTLASLPRLALATSIVFGPALLWTVFVLILWWRVPAFRSRMAQWWRTETDVKVLTMFVAVALWIVHFMAPAESWEYQIPGYLIVVVLLAAMTTSVIDVRVEPGRTILMALLVAACSVGLWSYLSDSLWRPTSTLHSANEASALLAERARSGDTLLGGFNHLALASGLRIYPGNEMGVFSVADGSSPAETTARHFLSKEAVTEALVLCSATFVATDPVAVFRMTTPGIQEISASTRDQWRDLLQDKYRVIYMDDRSIFADGGITVFERIQEMCNETKQP